MRTKDVIKMGIDRNFLRECERKKIISPEREVGIDISGCYGNATRNMKKRIYTQSDVEMVWCTYLYRQVGLTYPQIRDFLNGEEVKTRNSILNRIKEIEKEIEQKRALLDFMDHIKNLGFIPIIHTKKMNSDNFTQYLYDSIKYINDNYINKEQITYANQLIDKIERGEEIVFDEQELLNVFNNLDPDLFNNFSKGVEQMVIAIKYGGNSEEMQSAVENFYKVLNPTVVKDKNEFIELCDFLFFYENGFSVLLEKELRKEDFETLKTALAIYDLKLKNYKISKITKK